MRTTCTLWMLLMLMGCGGQLTPTDAGRYLNDVAEDMTQWDSTIGAACSYLGDRVKPAVKPCELYKSHYADAYKALSVAQTGVERWAVGESIASRVAADVRMVRIWAGSLGALVEGLEDLINVVADDSRDSSEPDSSDREEPTEGSGAAPAEDATEAGVERPEEAPGP